MLNYKLILFVATFLSGCAVPPQPTAVVANDPAASALDLVLRTTMPDRSVGPETRPSVPVYGIKTSVSFLGDAAVLLKNAAAGSGQDWTFSQTGPLPHLPIYVQVEVKEVPFVGFLKVVAEQLGQRADIELGNKTITLRYRANN